MGASLKFKDDNLNNSAVEVFGKVQSNNCTYKGALDSNLNTRLFNEWKINS